MKKNNVLTIILVAAAMAGAGFFAGVKYQQLKRPAGFRQFAGGRFGNGQGMRNVPKQGNANFSGGRQNFRPINGKITGADEKSITVKAADGSSKIIIYSETTKINKTTEATKEDLKVGESVMVVGTEGTDGTITAQVISVGQEMGVRRLTD